MCRCAAAVARAVVAFLDAVLVGCLLSFFRPRRGSGSGSGGSEQDAPVGRVGRDRDAEVTWDHELGLGRNERYDEEFTCGSMGEEELRIECDNNNMTTIAPETNCGSPLEANLSEGYQEERHAVYELSIEDTQHLPGVELVTHPAFLEKSPLQSIQHKIVDHSGSPFATPLVLRDDMHTPGTIYTSHRGTSLSGKRVQTRKQFIHPILRPIENRLKQMEKEDSSPLPSFNPPKRTNLEAHSIKKPNPTHSSSVVKSGLSKTSSSFPGQVKEALSPDELTGSGKLSKGNSHEKNAALSLSHWLKSSSTDVENQGDVKGAAASQSYGECSFPTERPVLNAPDLENPTPELTKAWDDSGIPNTTTRYREDQRVSWHTTPFEERLLKVLSDKEHCPPRKLVHGKLFRQEEKAV